MTGCEDKDEKGWILEVLWRKREMGLEGKRESARGGCRELSILQTENYLPPQVDREW